MQSEVNKAMLLLANGHPRPLFMGQGVEYGGVATYHDLEGIPVWMRQEWPVAEELQLGAAIGLSLQGYLPIAIFPRIDFLMRAMDQLVNHLDKLEEMSRGDFCPKVIIRTRVGSKRPLDAGPQHTNDHSAALSQMLTSVWVCKVTEPDQVVLAYQTALERRGSTLVVEALA